MKLFAENILLAGVLILLLYSCQPAGQVALYADKPFNKLSDYHFFMGRQSALKPNTGVLPYDLITPLFSDYAEKARFVWMPEGQSAQILENGDIDFPEGTVLIKNFFYDLEARRQLIETRLLVREESGWTPLTYIWDESQRDASLSITGGFAAVDVPLPDGTSHSIRYVIPNKNQCKTCHESGGNIKPIGPKVKHLNREYTYEEGSANQLAMWTNHQFLNNYSEVDHTARTIAWDDPSAPLEDRALAYLEVNCGTCHKADGSAYVSGLHISPDSDPYQLGICKTPVSAGKGSGGFRYDINPGHPESSILVYRMKSDDPGAMMPEIGRKMMHSEGVQLISDWIASMDGSCD